MTVFFLIVFVIFVSSFVWWAWADAWMRKTRRAVGWRVAIAVWALFQAGAFAYVFYSRATDSAVQPSAVLTAAVYLWHLIVMPPVLIALLIRGIYRATAAIVAVFKHPSRPAASVEQVGLPVMTGPSRRQLLATALVAATPPLAQVVATTTALAMLGTFRIRTIDIAFANLPPALDGASIAHLSDTHLGRFTTRDDVGRILDATNQLNVDAVAFTGDLIEFNLDDLPLGLDLLRGLSPRHRVVVCEGNHDLFQDRGAFENGVRSAGFPLLLNESHTLDIRGYPVQFLGMGWGSAATGRSPQLERSAAATLARRRSDAFSVLLAHHPLAFDYAAEAGVDLTLAGHTHGGQLMLTPNLGPGPMMYKYWSGLYRQGQAACVVSNGIGNWFPLRVNAPAEIVRITLRHA